MQPTPERRRHDSPNGLVDYSKIHHLNHPPSGRCAGNAGELRETLFEASQFTHTVPRNVYRNETGGRAKKTNPASFCRMAERETEHDEGGRKRYESTGARFRVTRLRKMAASQPTISGCCGVCAGKTQVSKVAGRLWLVTAAAPKCPESEIWRVPTTQEDAADTAYQPNAIKNAIGTQSFTPVHMTL